MLQRCLSKTGLFLAALMCAFAACVFSAAPAWCEETVAINEPVSQNPGPIDLGEGNYVNPLQMPDSSFIYDITLADLATADSYLNAQTVQVVGEVIGDCINGEFDPAHCWIVLSDSAGNTVQVQIPMESKDMIDTFGRYGQTGTIFQVRGTFNLACSDHQGLTDIHSDHEAVVSKGVIHRDQFVLEDFAPGAILVGIGLLILFVYWRMRERMR